MKKIFLFCEAGMSTSLMVSKMQEVAKNIFITFKFILTCWM